MGEEFETLEYFRRLLEDPSSGMDLPAAVLVETIQGEGGVNVASIRWLRELEMLCDEFDILLIVDDIQVGCGRTGPFFSFEPADIQPDMVTLSKSIGGYGLPLSLVLIKPEWDQWQPGQHTGTFRGNNLAFVATTRVLNHYWTTPNLSRNVRAKGAMLSRGLTEIAESNNGDHFEVRGRGLIQGLACDPPELADRIGKSCFERGLIVETSGSNSHVLKCLPPLVVEEEELSRAVDIIGESVEATLGQTAPSKKNQSEQ
jgi:diaminobutyrate-2-oxoglutarate transaminase